MDHHHKSTTTSPSRSTTTEGNKSMNEAQAQKIQEVGQKAMARMNEKEATTTDKKSTTTTDKPNKIPAGYKSMTGADLKVGYIVWNIKGSKKDASVPAEPVAEKIVDLVGPQPGYEDKPYNHLTLQLTKGGTYATGNKTRKKYISFKKSVSAKAGTPPKK